MNTDTIEPRSRATGAARPAAILLAAVLSGDCALHLFWTITGSPWPAATQRALSCGLLNADVPFSPPVLLPLAAMLAVAALLVLARAGLVLRRLPRWLPALGTLAIVLGTGVRAVAGLVWIATDDPASTFHRLNLAAYTPLCILLSLTAILLLRTTSHPR